MKLAIIGAGLMGRVLAFSLHQAGCTELILIDKDDFTGQNSPAYIAAGMLSLYCESITGGSVIYELGKASLCLWQKYLKHLAAGHLYNDKGTILLAPAIFNADITHYLAKIRFNTGSSVFYTLLNHQELTQLEPELNFNAACLLPDEASLNAREVFKLLGSYLSTHVNWYSNTTIQHQSPIQLAADLGIDNKFEWVIDCRGLGSKPWIPELRGVRGEIIRVYAPEVNISRPVRMLHPRHNIYVNPYGTNHYVIGATEIEAEDYSSVSVRSCLDLMNYACMVHSGFAEARIIEISSNCRPALINNLPNIAIHENYITINGLYRHGYLLAPILAEIVKNYLSDSIKLYPEIWSS